MPTVRTFHWRLSHVLAAAALLALPAAASSAPYRIDHLSVTRHGSLIFEDGFDDGAALPPGPSFIGSSTPGYVAERVVGNFSSSEQAGKLGLDPRRDGVATINPFTLQPEGVAFQAAYLNVNTQSTPETAARGLKLGHSFEVRALFDLVTPARADGFDSYGLRLADFDNPGALGWNDVLDLQLFKSQSTGGPVLLLIERDFRAGTRVQHGLLRPDPAQADQIELFFLKSAADDPHVSAGYRLFDKGVAIGGAQVFATAPALFDGEVFTRPGFFAVSQVPEPASAWLLAGGGLFVAWRQRRRSG